MLNRARDVLLRAFHSGCDAASVCEPGGDRRGECAPRAVYDADVGAWSGKLREDPVVKQQVDRLLSMKMAPFDHNGPWAEPRNSPGRFARSVERIHLHAGECR